MKPYFTRDAVSIYHCDCRELIGVIPADVVVTDPPYGDTSLDWDVPVSGWTKGIGSDQLWCFGSMRFFLTQFEEFKRGGWKYAQEIVWEKHNGSGFQADRFKRVHEFAMHFYRGEWSSLFRNVPKTADATKRTIRHKTRPPHTGHIEMTPYSSTDGGPRLMRSVLQIRSCHGYAVHPTQKPVGILTPLIQFSCPPNGCVLDPFMGSGSTLIAARELGLKAVGGDVDEACCETAAKRLEQSIIKFEE